MQELIRAARRIPRQRVRASLGAEPLAEPWNPGVSEAGLKAPCLIRLGLVAVAR